ncbi:pantoate--beta-alanine ligase [Runella sp.]|jgi:pantoate--beta-alanine ligase|uniref:pantoate--beta-alanine ligase n=1 Tax=Runella sp. TaxID=1960881 RepID=UPI002625C4DB|nr:pantoate--beta-alanine ligase [Runella sp.]
MQVFHTIADLRYYLLLQRLQGKSVGFVPTMGALHVGHLSLIEASRLANDLTVCSIFVNPIQFNNPDDLARYPRTLEADCVMLDIARCDVVFAPSAEEMYAEKPVLKFDFGDLERVMEGKFRPGHFNGVGIVVAKLFNIVQPERTYFGQKDLQQVAVIRRMMIDLGFQMEHNVCATLREADGLAMSSRNRNLTPDERQIASHIYKGLCNAKEALVSGKTTAEVQEGMTAHFAEQPAFRLEYFEIVHAHTLQTVEAIQPIGETALCIAAYLGKVRLIDNVIF